jgi:3'-phosphoadenosine 5'-phosphosulfate (PAPS) 3'-phosphatase
MDICRDIHKLITAHLPEILALRSTGSLKADNSFVSEGDLFCEKLIMDYLKANLSNYAVISEESENEVMSYFN